MNKKEVVLAMLFVSKEPLTSEKIAKIMEVEERVILRWLYELETEFNQRGIRIRKIAGGYEMVTSTDSFHYIQQIVPTQYETLSKSARQTVTIIALHQPVTRAKIGQLREVKNPDAGIEPLVDKKLIKMTDDGYVTTDGFLKHFGVNDLEEFLERLNELVSQKNVLRTDEGYLEDEDKKDDQ